MTDSTRISKRRWLRFWLLAALLVSASAALVDAAFAEPSPTPACIHYWPEARYQNYAYDHIVHILNACEAPAICAVSSDVVEAPVKVTIAPGDESTVWLLRGSPIREFAPRLDCALVP